MPKKHYRIPDNEHAALSSAVEHIREGAAGLDTLISRLEEVHGTAGVRKKLESARNKAVDAHFLWKSSWEANDGCDYGRTDITKGIDILFCQGTSRPRYSVRHTLR